MSQLNDITITFEIEPIVKLVCKQFSCKNNIAFLMAGAYCNLKHIAIGEDGACECFEQRNNERSQAKADSQKET
jgi:hypothetical protein